MKKLLFIFVLAALSLGFMGACTSQAKSDGSIMITVLDINGIEVDSKEVDFFTGDTLVNVLERSEMGFQYETFTYGTMITGFEGITLGATEYLKFFVNDVSSSTGVDGYELIDGDHIMFRVTDWTLEN